VPEDSKAKAPQPFGPFVLERRIAVGGSAEVFLARPKIGTQPAAHLVVKRLLRSVREDMGLDPDPIGAYKRSGYLAKIAAERVGGTQAGWGA
jgi:hypothetical protein